MASVDGPPEEPGYGKKRTEAERERTLGAWFVLLLEDMSCSEMKLTGFGGCEEELGQWI